MRHPRQRPTPPAASRGWSCLGRQDTPAMLAMARCRGTRSAARAMRPPLRSNSHGKSDKGSATSHAKPRPGPACASRHPRGAAGGMGRWRGLDRRTAHHDANCYQGGGRHLPSIVERKALDQVFARELGGQAAEWGSRVAPTFIQATPRARNGRDRIAFAKSFRSS